ncbi:hypothetical protein A5715_03980, partial [Mycolicibacter heraklionensis]
MSAFLEAALIEPATLLVEGEAGIGKSTLLWDAAARAVERGYRVLSAAGAPTEVRYAYTAVADLLGGVDAEVLAGLPDQQRAAVDRVLLGGSDGPASDERMLATAFLEVIRRMSAVAPVLLCVDDAQWLDMSSQMVIGFAQRRFVGRVGLMLTVRTGTSDTPDLNWLNPARPSSLTRLRVAPLSLGGVHALVLARLGHTLPRPTITRIHETSGGNPFFALELARFIDEDPARAAISLPDALVGLVRDRIGNPDAETGAILLATACAAQPTVERVSLATGISSERVVELAESEPARGVVTLDGCRLRFCHPLFATGVFTSAGPAAQRAMHRRLADTVEEPELAARHLALAATTADEDVLKALDAAATVTQGRGAPAVAAELIELAINLGGDTPVRRLQAAEQHFRAGSVVNARAHLELTLEDLPAGGLRCAALTALAAVTGYADSMSDAADLFAQAIDTADDPVLQLQARLLLVPTVGMIGKLNESVEHASVAVAQAEQLQIDALRSQALAIQAVVRFIYGLGVDQRALQTAIDLEGSSGNNVVTFQATTVAGIIAGWRGELDAARAQLHIVGQRCLRNGTEIDILWVAHHATMVDLWAGRYADAESTVDEAVQRAEQMGAKHVLIEAWIGQAEVAAYTGRTERACAIATAALESCGRTDAVLLADAAVRVLAFVEVSRGDYMAAVNILQPLLDTFDPEHDTEIVTGGYL